MRLYSLYQREDGDTIWIRVKESNGYKSLPALPKSEAVRYYQGAVSVGCVELKPVPYGLN